MKMNRIKWDESMYHRCLKRTQYILTEQEMNTPKQNSKDKKVQSRCSDSIKKHTNDDTIKNINDLREEKTRVICDYTSDDTILERDSDVNLTNSQNNFYGIGVGQCIECQIVPAGF